MKSEHSALEEFFLISAFLAWKSITKHAERRQKCSFKCKIKWFGSRLLRLALLYYVFLCIYLILIYKGYHLALGKNSCAIYYAHYILICVI